MAFTLERIKPEALKVGDVIHIDPYDLEITHTSDPTPPPKAKPSTS